MLEGESRKTSGFAMAQKDPRSQTALVLVVDDDDAILEITAEDYKLLATMFSPLGVELKLSNDYARPRHICSVY